MVRAVVLGDCYVELAVSTERLPRPHQMIEGRGFQAVGRGRGVLQALTAANMGADVTFIGRVGMDAQADVLLRLLEHEGVYTDNIVRDQSAPTGVRLTITDTDGKPLGVQAAGANHRLTASDVERAQSAIHAADVVITQLGTPLPAVRRALELACEREITTVLKPAPFTALSPDLLALAQVVTPNDDELRALARYAPLQDAPRRQITVCTLGARGAQWFRHAEGDEVRTGRVPGFPARVRSTEGAGDVFSAALGVALAEGETTEAAIRFANAAGACAVMLPGEAAPTRTATERMMA